LRALPLLGSVLVWLTTLIRLPALRDQTALQLAALQTHNAQLQQRLDALETSNAGSMMRADLAEFYVAFEDQFRGGREDIKQRLHVYLPRIAHLAGDARACALDIGCGRGEWLELLAEQDIRVIGVDSNAAMVAACVARGQSAHCADAITYLRSLPAGSLALVTGFHIIEHIPFATQIALLDAALLALRPGGCLILETPNPENLRVGACSFYTDPTHLRPLLPDVAQFMARQRGYADTEILRLHPCPESERLALEGATQQVINDALFGARDFALIATKAH
jgi:O-antigen chain-terminating methyltransferase